ncbi:pirin family protein [Methylobacterium komagatae]
MIEKAARVTENAIESGGFIARAYLPGHLKPGHADHGLGPLAAIMESFLAPGTHIKLHEHVQDEIISWVPAGCMRHDDPNGEHLVVDAGHLMVMNAGRGFQHEERVLESDPPLRMLQIFVRPHAPDLEPGIQFGPLPAYEDGTWRLLFGPPGSVAPFHVRNRVTCHDIRLKAGEEVALPKEFRCDTYFFVFEGGIEAEGTRFGEGETGLCSSGEAATIRASQESLVIAFVIDPEAEIHRGGTIGDGETVQRMAAMAHPR